MIQQPYKALGRDLYCELQCACPDPKWADTEVAHLFKRKITLVGYADDHFFDVVNRHPQERQCECGRRLMYQWTRGGVYMEWLNTAERITR